MTNPQPEAVSDDEDEDDIDPPFICPLSKEPCVRAFCEDYGCADKLRIPIDDYDRERGCSPRTPSRLHR